MYFNTYMDSPAIAAFDLKTNGVQINGGHIQWPDTTSFPDATFAEVEATVSSNMVISNVDCLNMSSTAGIPGSPAGATGVWISYMGTNGSAPSYSSISNLAGCGQYVQQRVAARQTAFDMAGNNSSNTNYGSGQPGVTPKVFVTPLSSQANEGGVEVENFTGGQGDSFLSGFSGQASNFAVMADGTVRHTGLQTSAVFATSSTTLTKANHIVLGNATSGAFTLTLPSCYTAMPDGLTPTGMEFTIVKTDTTANAVQLATSSSETISILGSKASSYSLTAAGGLTLVQHGADRGNGLGSGGCAIAVSGGVLLHGHQRERDCELLAILAFHVVRQFCGDVRHFDEQLSWLDLVTERGHQHDATRCRCRHRACRMLDVSGDRNLRQHFIDVAEGGDAGCRDLQLSQRGNWSLGHGGP
jgi:hypothetical protein